MTARPRKPTFVQLLDASQRATLTDAELRAYYAGVSAYEDITFWLATSLRLEHQEREALLTLRQQVGRNGGKHTPATRQAWSALRGAHWRRRRLADLAAGRPEVGADPTYGPAQPQAPHTDRKEVDDNTAELDRQRAYAGLAPVARR
jgi:hypothetical protein